MPTIARDDRTLLMVCLESQGHRGRDVSPCNKPDHSEADTGSTAKGLMAPYLQEGTAIRNQTTHTYVPY